MSDPLFFQDIIDEFERMYEPSLPNEEGLERDALRLKYFSRMLVDDTSRFPMGFVYIDEKTHWDFAEWMVQHHPEQQYLA